MFRSLIFIKHLPNNALNISTDFLLMFDCVGSFDLPCLKMVIHVLTNESDPHSYEATKAVALRKLRKKSEASVGFKPMTSMILMLPV